MDLDPERCYRAALSRDRRFDGRFFTGVTSTGVYCRPICPVHPPRFENCRFFACAAAAEEAGFRACMRCRPETAPGTPAWLGTSATVSRALRLISEGALDSGDVESLAGRLGVGGRHLRRLFALHLGASPLAVARTRRAHFARRLIDESSLPMAEIAFAAGFGSVRQFNHALAACFRRPPSALRRARVDPKTPPPAAGGDLVLKLPYRAPLDWQALLGFLRARATPGVEAVAERSYRRTLDVDGSIGTLEVEPVPGEPQLRLRLRVANPLGAMQIAERVRRLFDLGADPAAIAGHLRRDRLLADLVAARPGLRVPGAWDGFELAVRAILGQQVSVRGATTLMGRLVGAFGVPLSSGDPELTLLFPRPEALAEADLSSIGITSARADALRALSAAVCAGTLRLDGASELDSAVERLTGIRGVGPWTAQYIALRALGCVDAFPAGDLGLRRALSNGRRIGARELERLAERWRPWRGYAAMHLWTKEMPHD